MLCMENDDNILPCSVAWTRNHCNNPRFHCSVLGVVLKAQASVLQYMKLLSSIDYTRDDCVNIQKMGELCILHTLYLHHLKQCILGTKETEYGGIKLHASINHIHTQILLFGSPKYHDTVRFEHQHAEDGVAAAAQTSRRPNSMSSEMLTTVLIANLPYAYCQLNVRTCRF
jgi:hypothetical protein